MIKLLELEDCLAMSQDIQTIKNTIRDKQPYHINVLDDAIVLENENSSILASLFRQHDESGKYGILTNFMLRFFGETLSSKIKNPKITTEELVRDGKRIDLFVQEPGAYAIIMENKVLDAPKQPHQLANYIEGVREMGYTDDQIWIAYLPSTKEGGPDEQSWISRRKVSYKVAFANRYRNISFRDDILPWLQSDFMQHWQDPKLRASILLYTDYLEGLFHLRKEDDMENDEVKKYIHEHLNLTGDKIHDTQTIVEKLHELDDCRSLLDTIKKENEVVILQQWAEKLEKKYSKNVATKLTGSQPYISLTVPFKDQDDAITVIIEDIRNVLCCGIMPSPGFEKQFNEMLEWCRPLLDKIASFKRGQQWILWRQTTLETGLKDMEDVINVLSK